MWLALIIVVIGGIGMATRPRPVHYLMYVTAAALWAWPVGPFLLIADGTISTPEGDGLITGVVRRLLNDSPWMGLYAIAILFVFYGLIVWLLRKALSLPSPSKPQ